MDGTDPRFEVFRCVVSYEVSQIFPSTQTEQNLGHFKEAIVMANFKQILAMCRDGASYTQIAHTLGWGLTLGVSIFRGSGPHS